MRKPGLFSNSRRRRGQDYCYDMMRHAPIGGFVSTTDGALSGANIAAATLFGFTDPGEMKARVRDIRTYVCADPDVREEVQRLLSEEGSIHGYECKARRHDGTEFWISYFARELPELRGRKTGYQHYIHDITPQKERHDALLRTQFAMDRAPDNALWIDRNGRILYANNAACASLGYSRDELQAKRIFDIDPDVPEADWREEAQTLKRSGTRSFESRHRTKDGRTFPVEIKTNYFEYDNDFLAISFDRDISDRKTAEAALQEHIGLLEATFNATDDGILVVDNEFNVTHANRQYYEMWRVPEAIRETRNAAALREVTMAQIEDLEGYMRLRDAARHENRTEPMEIRLNDGRIFLSLSAPMVMNGDRVGYVYNFRDISAQRRAEELLKASERRFRRLFENAPTPMAHIGLDGRILGMNKELTRTLGYSLENTPTLHAAWRASIPDPDERERITSAWVSDLERAVNNGTEIRAIEHSLRTLAGDEKILEINTTVLNDSAIVSFHDITARVFAERRQKTLQEQLHQSQKLEAVGVLAGGVAHDFNNMLGAIVGYAELTTFEMEPDDPLLENIQVILESAHRSADLVRQLLTFARKQTVNPVEVDVNKAVDSILKMITRIIGENIELAWIPSPDPCPTRIDTTQLDQLLLNLCVNARDAISGVGRIAIETKSVEFDDRYCEIHAGYTPGRYIRLSVGDNGCGMTEETVGHIFEPFFTTKDVGEGSGMGLSTVYGIVKQHDGFIHVSSEPGKGSTFFVFLPEIDVTETWVEHDSHDAIHPGNGETVLIVEDDPLLLKTSERMLRKLGYVVLTADNPVDAVRMVTEHDGPIHLLIADVVMPEMNGRVLAQELQAICPEMKQLFVSGYTENVISHRGMLDPDVHFLNKPFSLREISRKVRDILS